MGIYRFFRAKSEEYFHSSGYARLARGERIGSTSPRSFNDRTRADRNRKAVRNYREATIVNRSVRQPRVNHDSAGQTEPSGPSLPKRPRPPHA